MMLDYTKKSDVEAVANMLETVLKSFSEDSISSLAIQLLDHRLMQTSIPWYLRAIGRLKGWDDAMVRRFMMVKLPRFAKDIVAAAIAHARSGIDLYDIRSAGGFNQEELERLVSIMEPYVVELASTLTKA